MTSTDIARKPWWRSTDWPSENFLAIKSESFQPWTERCFRVRGPFSREERVEATATDAMQFITGSTESRISDSEPIVELSGFGIFGADIINELVVIRIAQMNF